MLCFTCDSLLKDAPLQKSLNLKGLDFPKRLNRPTGLNHSRGAQFIDGINTPTGPNAYNRTYHETYASFEAAISDKCGICLRLLRFLKRKKTNTPFLEDGELTPVADISFFEMRCCVTYETPTASVLSLRSRIRAKRSDNDKPSDAFARITLFSATEQAPLPELTPPAPNRTYHPLNLKLISDWISSCLSEHHLCRREQVQDRMFSRIIDVGNADIPSAVRLRDVSEVPVNEPYMTLSHCWGGAKIPILTAANYAEYSTSIALSELPLTFLDAIAIVRDLGIRYLWIDSLCIIQDSHEDWLGHASIMGQIYQKSYCNIAASKSKDPFGGLFAKREPVLITPLRVLISNSDDINGWFDVDDDFEEDWVDQVSSVALGRRAWVVQERLLAPRTIHFAASQLFWECAELQTREGDTRTGIQQPVKREAVSKFKTWDPFCENVTLGSRTQELSIRYIRSASNAIMGRENCRLTKDTPSTSRLLQAELRRACFGDDVWTTTHPLLLYWARIVELTYSNANLSRVTDRLVAISGLAKILSRRTGIRYVAGLWDYQLARQLLWGLRARVNKNSNSTSYIAPSWSWASTPVGFIWNIRLNDVLEEKGAMDIVKVLEVEVKGKRQEEQPMDELEGARLRIRGRLIPCEFDWAKWPEPEERSEHLVKYVDPSMADLPRHETFLSPVLFIRPNSRLPKAITNALILEATDSRGTFRRIGTARLDHLYPLQYSIPHLYAAKSKDYEDSDDDVSSDEGEETKEEDNDGSNTAVRTVSDEGDGRSEKYKKGDDIPKPMNAREERREYAMKTVQDVSQLRRLPQYQQALSKLSSQGRSSQVAALNRLMGSVESMAARLPTKPHPSPRQRLDYKVNREKGGNTKDADNRNDEDGSAVEAVVKLKNTQTRTEIVRREPKDSVPSKFYLEYLEDEDSARYGHFVYDII